MEHHPACKTCLMYKPEHDCVKLNAPHQTCPCMICLLKSMCKCVNDYNAKCEVYTDWYFKIRDGVLDEL